MLWTNLSVKKKQGVISPKLCERGTVLVQCSSSQQDISTSELQVEPLIFSLVCSAQNIHKFSETTVPTEAKFHVA